MVPVVEVGTPVDVDGTVDFPELETAVTATEDRVAVPLAPISGDGEAEDTITTCTVCGTDVAPLAATVTVVAGRAVMAAYVGTACVLTSPVCMGGAFCVVVRDRVELARMGGVAGVGVSSFSVTDAMGGSAKALDESCRETGGPLN